MSTQFTSGHLEIEAKPYPTWEAYADARQKAFTRLESKLRTHLESGLTIRETLGEFRTDWTWQGSAGYHAIGNDVVSHLISRYLGFGTDLELLPFPTTFGRTIHFAPGVSVQAAQS